VPKLKKRRSGPRCSAFPSCRGRARASTITAHGRGGSAGSQGPGATNIGPSLQGWRRMQQFCTYLSPAYAWSPNLRCSAGSNKPVRGLEPPTLCGPGEAPHGLQAGRPRLAPWIRPSPGVLPIWPLGPPPGCCPTGPGAEAYLRHHPGSACALSSDDLPLGELLCERAGRATDPPAPPQLP